jgi:hypothetical protein
MNASRTEGLIVHGILGYIHGGLVAGLEFDETDSV